MQPVSLIKTRLKCHAQAMCSLLFLACIALMLPTAARAVYPQKEMSDATILAISHYIAILLILA